MAIDWFEVEDDEVDDAQRAFVSVLQERAPHWPAKRSQTLVMADGPTWLGAYLDVLDEARRTVEMTVGAELIGDALRCGEVHNQRYYMVENSSVEVLEARGKPDELGRMAADWFGQILRRPL
jgi:hypothetical protein